MVDLLRFLFDLLSKFVGLLRYKPEPYDIALLTEMWKVINYNNVYEVCEAIYNGRIYYGSEQSRYYQLFDDYLPYRENPEHKLYDKHLEKILQSFDKSLYDLGRFTLYLFGSHNPPHLRTYYPIDLEFDGDEGNIPLSVESKDYQTYKLVQEDYRKMAGAAKNVLREHEKLLNELRRKRLLHQLTLVESNSTEPK